MSAHFPDFLRAIISATANVFMMMSLLQPKCSKKIMWLAMMGILAADLGTAFWCYLSGNLTMLAKIDLVLFASLCFIVRPLFKDSFMQWLFSYLTVQNTSSIVVVLSFILSRYLPYPVYANSLLRLIMFGAFIFLLNRYVRPLCAQKAVHWTSYFSVAVALALTFSYYVLFTDDIVTMLQQQAIPLLLVIFLGMAAYVSIFLSLKNLRHEYQVKEENQRMIAEREYLNLAVTAMTQQMNLMDEIALQNSSAAHDRRHFDKLLLKFLEQGENENAIALLKRQNETVPNVNRVYCENHIVNAAVSYYAAMAEREAIKTHIELEIPSGLSVDALELAMVVSNLMENAIQACGNLPVKQEKSISFICRNVGRLVIEMENTCASDVALDKEGYPIAQRQGHGLGSRGVIAFAKKYDSELMYTVANGVFRVRLLI